MTKKGKISGSLSIRLGQCLRFTVTHIKPKAKPANTKRVVGRKAVDFKISVQTSKKSLCMMKNFFTCAFQRAFHNGNEFVIIVNALEFLCFYGVFLLF